MLPSSCPSAVPSMVPSSPSSSPTIVPTQLPTVTPTSAPSIVPTLMVTNPPSSFPTFVQLPQGQSYQVTFQAENDVSQMSYSKYESDKSSNEEIFMDAVQCGFPCQVEIHSVVQVSRRRLDSYHYLYALNKKRFQATDTLQFTYNVTFLLGDQNEFHSADEAYIKAVSFLNQSIIYGGFEDRLTDGGGALM